MLNTTALQREAGRMHPPGADDVSQAVGKSQLKQGLYLSSAAQVCFKCCSHRMVVMLSPSSPFLFCRSVATSKGPQLMLASQQVQVEQGLLPHCQSKQLQLEVLVLASVV